jgi:DNA-binding transcriptional LysR family regulator
LRHLRAFLAIADRGSFAGAARVLGYTQPGVSQQIFALERIVGAPLFVRQAGGRRPLKLTAAGSVLLAHAQQLLARVCMLDTELERLGSAEPEVLTVVTIQSLATRVLPSVLARFRSEQPAVGVRIVEATSREALLAAVENGEADLGFTVLPVEGSFEVQPILSDPYVLVTRSDQPLRRIAQLHGKRLLVTRCRGHVLVEESLLAQGIMASAVERYDNVRMIEALVLAGEGVGVVPLLELDPHQPGLAVHVAAELPMRRMVAVMRGDLPRARARDRFLRLVSDASASLTPVDRAASA